MRVGLILLAALLLGFPPLGSRDTFAGSEEVRPDERGRTGGPHHKANSPFEEITQRGAFSYLDLDEVSTFSAARGSLELRVRRTAQAEGTNYFTLVRFEDGMGGYPVEMHVVWKYEPTGTTVLHVGGTYDPKKNLVWGWENDVGREVPVGETVTFTLTWGDTPAENRIYVNGQEIANYFQLETTAVRLPSERTGRFAKAIAGARYVAISNPRALEGLSRAEYDIEHDTELLSATFHDTILDMTQLAVTSVAHNAKAAAGFSAKLVAGDVLSVRAEGTPGVRGSFDVAHFPDLDRRIALDWRGWGVYLEEKPFLEPDEVNLRDVKGYRIFVRKGAFDPLAGGEEVPDAELAVEVQTYVVENLEIDTPYNVAVVAVMKDGTLRPVLTSPMRQPLTETEPGVYTGTWQVGYLDRFKRAVILARLSRPGAVSRLAGGAAEAFAVDPSLTLAVTTKPEVLKADEESASQVTVTVTDANGNGVAGHEIRFLLATTSQYTGVVGGGAFTDQVGGAIKADHRGVTDLFGRVRATYVAGFAAKTAVIVARDMASNSTGAGYVQTFIQGTAQLELEPAQPTEAMSAGYEIAVTSSDSWLTADGKSQARITARVTLAGRPVEGHRVAFTVASGTGQIRAVSETTGRNGEARAVYTAGTRIGLVLITATDTTVDISGSVQIELRSDAPAKLAITISPEKLPADGRSKADVTVLVTDINDNPNDNVEVEYAITEGGGDLKDKLGLTDRNGEAENSYTAGRTPGRVSIEITVRSTVPTEEEIAKARDLAVAVTDNPFF